MFQGDSFDLLEKVLWKVLEAHFDLPTWSAIRSTHPVCKIAAGMRSSLYSCLKANVYCLNELHLKLSAGSLPLFPSSFPISPIFQIHYYWADPPVLLLLVASESCILSIFLHTWFKGRKKLGSSWVSSNLTVSYCKMKPVFDTYLLRRVKNCATLNHYAHPFDPHNSPSLWCLNGSR